MRIELRGEIALELAGDFRLLAADFRDAVRQRDASLDTRPVKRTLDKKTLNPARLDPPFGHEPVGGQAALEMARRGAVLIVHVAADNSAEPLDVEKSVLKLEWIEGPLNEAEPSRDRVTALFKFHFASQTAVPVSGKHAQHMAMKVILAAWLEAGNAKAKGHHLAGIESAQHLAADFGCHDKEAQRKQLHILKTPDLALQTDNLGELGESGKLVNLNVAGRGRHRAEGSSLL